MPGASEEAEGLGLLFLGGVGEGWPRRGVGEEAGDELIGELVEGEVNLRLKQGEGGEVGGEVSLVPVSFVEPRVPRRKLVHRFRAALQLGGVDSSGFNFIVSATHGQAEVDQTVAAFDEALALPQEEGAL